MGALNYTKPIITKSNDKKPSQEDLKKLVNEYKITDIPTSSQTKQNISNSKQIQIWENAKERNTTPKSNNAVDRFFGGAIQGTVRTGIDFVNGGISTADWMLNTSAKAKKIQIKTAIDSIPLLPENISNIIKSNIATFQTGNAEKKGEIGGRIMGVIAIGAAGKALAPDILPIFKKNKADYIPETEWEYLKTSKGGSTLGKGAYNGNVYDGTGFGKLLGKEINPTDKGLSIVKQHLSGEFSDVTNDAMIDRIQQSIKNGSKLTDADASFYMHELNEVTLMKKGMLYDESHALSLEKYDVSPFSVYSPEVIKAFPDSFGRGFKKFWGIE